MKALQDPDLTHSQRQLLNQIQGTRYVVINTQHGGFGLSAEGIHRYLEITGTPYWIEENRLSIVSPRFWLVAPEHRVRDPDAETWHAMSMAERQQHNQLYSQQVFSDSDLDRDDPVLVQVVRELGKAVNSRFSDLKVIEIPADVEWQIEEYDGREWIAEKHRTWD
jgi:hypothetical protein